MQTSCAGSVLSLLIKEKMKIDHKIFVQLGLWKDPRWTTGKVLEKYEDGTCLVETHGQKLVVDSTKIKKYQKIVYDFEKQEFTEIQYFVNKNWDGLKNHITKAMSYFFPTEKIEIDEKEKIIYACNNELSVGGSAFEIETISCFKDNPEWSIVHHKMLPQTRNNPEDVDEINIGHSSNNITAASIFIDAVWNIKKENYWENKFYEELAEDASATS
jgi:hypothetical protein